MRIIFLDNSIYLNATSLNLKALDSIQKILLNFSAELSNRNHEVVIYNQARHKKIKKAIVWKNIKDLKQDKADILIVVQDIDLLKYKVKAKIKFLFLHYRPQEKLDKNIFINLIKQKFCILYSNNFVVSNLPDIYKYVPKLHFKIGVSNHYREVKLYNTTQYNTFVTTHPLKGLDWLIELWTKYVHTKIPWAELHIYSKLLDQNEVAKNIKIRNLKLSLELNKDSGIFIKSPLPQKEFISKLANYKIHLCPSLDNSFQYLSILESQACGIPVIARETVSIYDCIYNNETGYIVKDELSFARKIIQVLSDNQLFATLRNNSRLNNYVISWSDAVTNFERKLNENTFYW